MAKPNFRRHLTVDPFLFRIERLKQKKTQEEVAKALGYRHTNQYSVREQGNAKLSADDFVNLLDYFGYTLADAKHFVRGWDDTETANDRSIFERDASEANQEIDDDDEDE